MEAGPYVCQNRGPTELDRFTIPFPKNLSFVFVAYFIRAFLRGASFGARLNGGA